MNNSINTRSLSKKESENVFEMLFTGIPSCLINGLIHGGVIKALVEARIDFIYPQVSSIIKSGDGKLRVNGKGDQFYFSLSLGDYSILWDGWEIRFEIYDRKVCHVTDLTEMDCCELFGINKLNLSERSRKAEGFGLTFWPEEKCQESTALAAFKRNLDDHFYDRNNFATQNPTICIYYIKPIGQKN